MSPGVIYPGILRRLCKEPLGEVKCVQLRGRGIVRLEGLDSCPNLTSLDVSWNSLKQLDGAGLERCNELWIVDASHNQLENIGGLSCLMAVGYLNLCSNNIPLEGLRPLGRTHVLELCLGSSGSSAEKRRDVLGLLPNVWVLEGEYVTAQERCAADGYDQPSPCNDGVGNGRLLGEGQNELVRNPASRRRLDDASGGRGGGRRQSVGGKHREGVGQQEYRHLLQQGHQTKEFFENVVWKLPCRTGAADPFRLTTLIKRYDHRAAASNKSTWLSSFTRTSSGTRRARRDLSLPLPRPHSEVLLSLPLELKLDVAVLLTVRAAFRESLPQQVLADAFMVLLVRQKGLPEGIHNDLSRVPPFICTALVHVLRASLLLSIHEVADRGCADTTAPLLLDSLEMDLLDAIPSVVTGVEDAVDIWGTSRTSLGRDNTNEPRASSGRVVGVAGAGALSERSVGIGEGEGDGEGCDSEMSIDLGSVSAPAEEPRLSSRSDLDDLSAKENCRSQEGGGLAWAAAAGVPATEASPDARGAQTPERTRGVGGGGGSVDDDLEAHTPLPSLRLNRLCRRAVVLLTRSPACPDLVEFQTEPANRRTYDQMAPLLARAHMSFRDLHPESPLGGSVSGGNGASTLCEKYPDHAGGSMSKRQKSHTTSSECSGDDGFDYGCGSGQGDDVKAARGGLAKEVGSPEASSWSTTARSPKAGEMVQVLHDTWSVILHTDAEYLSVTVAPFQGVQTPPYNGDTRVDSRDLLYDPRGWWKHAHAVKMNSTVGPSPGRLHRLSRGLSASGLPWGAGSLNEALGNTRGPSYEPETQLLVASKGLDDNALTSASKPFRAAALGGSGATLTPPATSSGSAPRCCPHGAVGVFSAEGSWDPSFVVAPRRLVALQNKAAARQRGMRKARQIAWRRIDGPEASVAPRPMMPRCYSFTTTAGDGGTCAPVRSSTSIPGLGRSKPGCDARSPPRWPTAVAPYHGGRSNTRPGSGSRSASPPPSLSRAGASPVTGGQSFAVAAVDAWLELQREMGSLKMDNQLRSRGRSRPSVTTNILSRGMQGPTAPLAAKPVVNSSDDGDDDDCADIVSGAVAKRSPREVDLPTSARRDDVHGDTSTAVFELTQVSGGGHLAGGGDSAPAPTPATATIATTAAATATAFVSRSGATVTAEDIIQMGGEPSAESEGSGGGHQTPADDGRLQRRGKRRKSGQVDGGFGNNSSSRGDSIMPVKWKPCAYRSLEWFNVPSRKLFLVDPSSVTRVPRPRTATAEMTAAAAAGRIADSPRRFSTRPKDQKLKGDGGGGAIGGGGGSAGCGDSCPGGNHGNRGRGVPLGKGAGQPTTGAGGRKAVRGIDGVKTSAPTTFPPSAVLVRLPLYSANEAPAGVESGGRGVFKSSILDVHPGQACALRASPQQVPARLAVTPPKLKPIVVAETIQERSDNETVVPGGKSKETCGVCPSLLVGGGVICSATLECGPQALSPNERRKGCGGPVDRLPSPERPRLVVTPQRPTLNCRAPYVTGVSLPPPISPTKNNFPGIPPSCVRRFIPPPEARINLNAPVSVPDRENGGDKGLSRAPLSPCTVQSHSAQLESMRPYTPLEDRSKRGKAASMSRGREAGARTCDGDARSITSLSSGNGNSFAASLYAPPPPRSQGEMPCTVAKPFSIDLDECVSISSVNSLCEWNRATARK